MEKPTAEKKELMVQLHIVNKFGMFFWLKVIIYERLKAKIEVFLALNKR